MTQREKIIEVTTELINENHGDVTKVTARKIAEKAEIGLGLINYHFGNKEQLITECVQRIVSEQIRVFSPGNISDEEVSIEKDKQRLADWAKQVFEFLYANKSIISISILGDLQNNTPTSNSVYTQIGLEQAIQSDIGDRKKKHLIFTLASTMQSAFLQDNVVKSRLGFDLSRKKDREQYIESLVDMLFEGVVL